MTDIFLFLFFHMMNFVLFFFNFSSWSGYDLNRKSDGPSIKDIV